MAPIAPSAHFRILGPQPVMRPVLLSIPHAGRAYPADMLAMARVPIGVLRRLEDRRADLLVKAAVAQGFTAIIADAPRALIDLNRAEQDCDPLAVAGEVAGLSPSQRARGGLGLVPHRLHPEGNLWTTRLSAAELSRRITEVHRPWHAAIAALLADIARRFGAATLLDVHSMPPPPDGVELALGDRYGQTARSETVDQLIAIAEGQGISACRNHPYAGAFTIERHAAPKRRVQAIQIEVSRALYLGRGDEPDRPGCARIGAVIAALAAAAAADCGDGALPIAAE